MSISINQGDSTAELTTGSFWEVSFYLHNHLCFNFKLVKNIIIICYLSFYVLSNNKSRVSLMLFHHKKYIIVFIRHLKTL